MKLKSTPIAAERFKLDEGTGEFTGYAAVFNVRDHGGDVVMPGAFKRTIAERLPQGLIKVFRNHRDPTGMPVEMREDNFGLWVHGKLELGLAAARDMLAEMKSGLMSHMSFAYDVVKSERGEDASGRPILKLLDVELYEFGGVYWPMNDAARIESVKAIREALGTSPVDLTLPDAVALLKSAVAVLEQSGRFTETERQQVKDAQRDLGLLNRTLAGLPRTREDLAAAPEAPEQKTVLDLDPLLPEVTSIAGALANLRSAVESVSA